jgi:hypothetical protein
MATKVATPEWLTRHGAGLCGNSDGRTFAVYFGPELAYTLALVPSGGRYACRVKESINGRTLGDGSAHGSPEQALGAGLESLRQALGW